MILDHENRHRQIHGDGYAPFRCPPAGTARTVSTDPVDAEKNDAVLRAVKAELPDYTNNILIFDRNGNSERSYFKAALEGSVVTAARNF